MKELLILIIGLSINLNTQCQAKPEIDVSAFLGVRNVDIGIKIIDSNYIDVKDSVINKNIYPLFVSKRFISKSEKTHGDLYVNVDELNRISAILILTDDLAFFRARISEGSHLGPTSSANFNFDDANLQNWQFANCNIILLDFSIFKGVILHGGTSTKAYMIDLDE